jgi:hypothetical protein
MSTPNLRSRDREEPAMSIADITTEMQQILTSFCRGVDRHDPDIIAGCYAPRAYDDHGVYRGTAEGFITWVIDATAKIGFMQHTVSNLHLLGVSGETAASETYYHMRCVGLDGELAQVFGRYLDRWQRLDGSWLIANRVCTVEWASPNSGYSPEDFTTAAVDRTDPSYALTELLA